MVDYSSSVTAWILEFEGREMTGGGGVICRGERVRTQNEIDSLAQVSTSGLELTLLMESRDKTPKQVQREKSQESMRF